MMILNQNNEDDVFLNQDNEDDTVVDEFVNSGREGKVFVRIPTPSPIPQMYGAIVVLGMAN